MRAEHTQWGSEFKLLVAGEPARLGGSQMLSQLDPLSAVNCPGRVFETDGLVHLAVEPVAKTLPALKSKNREPCKYSSSPKGPRTTSWRVLATGALITLHQLRNQGL